MLTGKIFNKLSLDQRIGMLELNGSYLMIRSCDHFNVLLYGLSGFYVEVWQTLNYDICSVQCISDDDVVQLYLDELSFEFMD
jgi:hypothetical protein